MVEWKQTESSFYFQIELDAILALNPDLVPQPVENVRTHIPSKLPAPVVSTSSANIVKPFSVCFHFFLVSSISCNCTQ